MLVLECLGEWRTPKPPPAHLSNNQLNLIYHAESF